MISNITKVYQISPGMQLEMPIKPALGMAKVTYSNDKPNFRTQMVDGKIKIDILV